MTVVQLFSHPGPDDPNIDQRFPIHQQYITTKSRSCFNHLNLGKNSCHTSLLFELWSIWFLDMHLDAFHNLEHFYFKCFPNNLLLRLPSHIVPLFLFSVLWSVLDRVALKHRLVSLEFICFVIETNSQQRIIGSWWLSYNGVFLLHKNTKLCYEWVVPDKTRLAFFYFLLPTCFILYL